MLDEEAAVDVVVFVVTDGNHDDIGHLLLELDETGQFDDTWSAPCGPQIEDDDVATVLAEFKGSDAIADGEIRRYRADLMGMASTIAPSDQQHSEDYTCPDFSHITLHFL